MLALASTTWTAGIFLKKLNVSSFGKLILPSPTTLLTGGGWSGQLEAAWSAWCPPYRAGTRPGSTATSSWPTSAPTPPTSFRATTGWPTAQLSSTGSLVSAAGGVRYKILFTLHYFTQFRLRYDLIRHMGHHFTP